MNVELKDIVQWVGAAIAFTFPFLFKHIENRIAKEMAEHEVREMEERDRVFSATEKKGDEISAALAALELRINQNFVNRDALNSMSIRLDKRMDSIEHKLDDLTKAILELARSKKD